MKKQLIGLSVSAAARLLKEVGPNEIKEIGRVSWLNILFRQIRKNFIIYLLAGTVVISLAVGKTTTGYTILGIIVLIVVIGFIQEHKAERAIAALKRMIMPVTIVLRAGREQELLSRELVPGDIIILRTGEKIPADALILQETELRVNESVLTGEANDVRKEAIGKKTALTAVNQIFMGSHISSGKCVARVTATGMRTEFGKIAGLISKTEKDLPLQAKVNAIARYMVFIALGVSILTGLVMVFNSWPLSAATATDILIVVIALSVAAFPEGFPVVLMSTLAGGAYKMAKENAIVNRMSIIETLGETTVICSDKTGTITTGEMTVKKIIASEAEIEVGGSGFNATGDFIFKDLAVEQAASGSLKLALKIITVCNDAFIERTGEDNDYRIIGSPTEGALLIAAAKAGIFKSDVRVNRLKETPFNSERKMMSVTAKQGRHFTAYVKGAPEIIFEKCSQYYGNGEILPFTPAVKKRFVKFSRKLANKRYRIIAAAYQSGAKLSIDENNLILVALFGLEDSPRENVKEALAVCRQAGIKVKMITGDNPQTAREIGREVGLPGSILTGQQIDRLSDTELARLANQTAIFARVRPEHKLRIVRALKKRREIVTMTGDGVNDAPALKEAHIGVAMGKNGTDVSREAADLVLKDDNFETIVLAIKAGRTIYNNIQKFVTYQLSLNYAELMIIFLAIILGLPLPLLALQILFMNMVTDNLPAISLGFNPSSRDAMARLPRRNQGLLTWRSARLLIIAGTIIGAVSLSVFYGTLKLTGDLSFARTNTLVTLILLEIANAFNFRSFRQLVFRTELFRNRYLIYASIISLIATVAVIYSQARHVFELTPLSLANWLILALVSLTIIIVFDALKLLTRRPAGLV